MSAATHTLRRLFFYQATHHAEMWRNASGEVGYAPACEQRFSEPCRERGYRCAGCPMRAPTPLTEARLQAHLDGEITLGAYQLREDRTVGWGCVDVDAAGDTAHARWNARLRTLEILARLQRTGVPAYPEFSGAKGFHIWLFCPEGCPATPLRRLLRWAVDAVAEEMGDYAGVQVEVFPKQDQLDAASGEPYGNLVKVPLGLHRKTLRRAVFVDEALQVYRDQVAFLDTIRTVTAAQVSEAAVEWLPVGSPLPREREGTARPGEAPERGRLARATRDFLAEGAPEGERNNRLFRAAADMVGNGYAPEDVAAQLLPPARACGLPDSEAQRTIDSACAKERTPAVPADLQAEDHYELTPEGEIYFYKVKPIYARGAHVANDWVRAQVCNFSAAFEREVVEIDGDEQRAIYRIGGRSPDRVWAAEIRAEDFRDERQCRALIGAQAGARAMIHSARHLPLAIQALSNGFTVERRYVSTGWQMVDGELAYLTPGAYPGLCDVEAECRRYHVAPGDLDVGLHALLDGLLEAFDHRVTYVAVAHAFLAPLYRWIRSAKRYALHLVGETGSLKTSYACALLGLYGPEFANEEPTEKWTSTWKKVEVLGHQAKDVLFLVDDYKPRLVRATDVATVIQNYSESRGRGRLNRDASIQASRWIRGALITTGEDIPENEASVITRMLILRLSRPVGPNDALALAQRQAPHLNGVMHAYTAWLARTMPGTEEQVTARLTAWRDGLLARCPRGCTNPGRLAGNIAQNRLAFWTLGRWLVSASRWTEAEFEERLAEYDVYAGALLGEMAERISREKASSSYLTAIRALIESGERVLLPRDRTDSAVPYIGWRDDDHIYLLPDVAYQAAERWFRSMGGSIGFSRRAVEEQLLEDGLLEPDEERGRRRTTKVVRVGPGLQKTVRALKLRIEALEEEVGLSVQEELPF